MSEIAVWDVYIDGARTISEVAHLPYGMCSDGMRPNEWDPIIIH